MLYLQRRGWDGLDCAVATRAFMSLHVWIYRFVNGTPSSLLVRPILGVLDTYDCVGQTRCGAFVIHFTDGSCVDFLAPALCDGLSMDFCAFLRGTGQECARCIYEVALAGDGVIMPFSEDAVPILTRRSQYSQLPSDYANQAESLVVCENAEQLWSLLRDRPMDSL